MKILIFSDVHGNVVALEKLLSVESTESFDAVIYCGDSVGYFPYGETAINCLWEIPGIIAVKGNHDRNLVLSRNDGAIRGLLATQYGSAYAQDYAWSTIEYLDSLPEKIEIVLGGLSFGIVHGMLDDPLEGRFYPDNGKACSHLYEGFDVVVCGHTHYRMRKEVGRTTIVNPGSLGQPRDGGGFSYCIFDTETKEVHFEELDVDRSKIRSLLDYEPNERIVSYLKEKMSL